MKIFPMRYCFLRSSIVWSRSASALGDIQLIVSITGHDETFAQTIHARHMYRWSEVLWNRRFVDLFQIAADGSRLIDYTKFHETDEMPALYAVPEQRA